MKKCKIYEFGDVYWLENAICRIIEHYSPAIPSATIQPRLKEFCIFHNHVFFHSFG